MRLSTFRLWLSAGLSLLVVEFLLFIGFAVWTKSEISRMERDLHARADKWKEENARLSLEMRTVNRKVRERIVDGFPDLPNVTPDNPGGDPGSGEASPEDLVRQFRDAILIEDKEGEKRAAGALRGLGGRAVNALINAIPPEQSGFIRSHLFRLLGSIPGGASISFLQSQFGSQVEKSVQLAILDGLILQPDATSLPLLKTALVARQEGEVRIRILEAVRSVGTAEAAGVLILEFEQATGGSRSKILDVMVGMKSPPLGNFFQDLLRNADNASFRIMSIKGLVALWESGAVPVLETIRDSDPDEKVKEEAKSAIEALKG